MSVVPSIIVLMITALIVFRREIAAWPVPGAKRASRAINPSRDFIRRRDSVAAVGFWERLNSNPHCHVRISASNTEAAWLLGGG